MPVHLDKSISWMNADDDETRMLQYLQGNILKGHGRKTTAHLFFRIDPASRVAMRAALRLLAERHMHSALRQLQDAETLARTGQAAGAFVALLLACSGYKALGVPEAGIPADPHFRAGMRQAKLGDPPVAEWEAAFRQPIDGMVLIGGTPAEVQATAQAVRAMLTGAGGTIVAEQAGRALFNAAGEGIEHFGYVDGRSQPLPLLEDVANEENGGGIGEWNPGAPLNVALVPDPAVGDGVSFGSYFIFRKLEQDVLGFKRREQALADALGLAGEARERAGALVVGRFEDGTPVTLHKDATGGAPPNDFNYDQDLAGAKCPFQAHIRKTNPRGTGGFEPPAEEKAHLMIRRGIPYEDKPRAMAPKDLPDAASAAEFEAKMAPYLPSGGVGLLFMAYNRDLGQQFEFTQVTWANNPAFPKDGAPSKLDPVIGGPGQPAPGQHWPRGYDNPAAGQQDFPFAGFVHMRGGEYFFAPSLTMLHRL